MPRGYYARIQSILGKPNTLTRKMGKDEEEGKQW